MKARMNRTIKCIETKLVLTVGQAIFVQPADNKHKFFAWPIDRWPDGVKRGSDDSILITDSDFTAIAE